MSHNDDPTLAISPTSQSTLDAPDGAQADIPRRIGRYVVLAKLGAGGGGVVYRAYDPDLHRQVAVKVLRPGVKGALASRDRLLREAQAIAQLSHPNVIAVYDVGIVDTDVDAVSGNDGIFIVMELAPGPTLKEWLTKEAHPWREVLQIMLAAGQGLVAAHARGLVHRDFKPANVLVGSDGRVRVLDFGLARLVGSDASLDGVPAPRDPVSVRQDSEHGSDHSTSSGRLLSSDLTGAGDVVGTPAYMAPEQHAGQPADERTDQYGFCVTLFEALLGRKPFEAKTVDALLEVKLAGPQPIEDAKVPRRIIDAIVRGLSPSPADRFANMQALLEVLEFDPGRRWRRVVPIVAIGSVAAVTTVLGVQASRSGAPACDDSKQRLVGVWDDAVRARARRAFDSTELPYAMDAWRSVEDALAQHTASWVDERNAACREALVEGRQSTEVMAAQMICLDRALERVEQVGALFQRADPDVVQNAVALVRRLESPEHCQDASDDLAGRRHLDDAARAALLEHDRELERADVLVESGKYEKGEALATKVSEAAHDLEDWRLAARAERLRCRIALSNDRFVDARARCRSSLMAAERSGDPALAIDVLARLARTLYEIRQVEAAQAMMDVAKMRFEALPASRRTPRLEAYLAHAQGNMHYEREEYETAEKLLSRALQLREEYLGPVHPDLLPSLNGLALVAQNRGDHDLALARYERAMKVAERAHGRMHPVVAALLNNQGGLWLDQGENERALDVLQRALEIKRATLPDESPRLVTTTRRVGLALLQLGRFDEALPYLEEALRLHELGSGDAFPATVESRLPVAKCRLELGQPEAALVQLDKATRIIANAPDKQDPALRFRVPLERGRALVALGDDDEAAQAYREAIAVSRRGEGEASKQTVLALVELAELEVSRGNAAPRDVTEAAAEAVRSVDLEPGDRAEVERRLRALRSSGRSSEHPVD